MNGGCFHLNRRNFCSIPLAKYIPDERRAMSIFDIFGISFSYQGTLERILVQYNAGMVLLSYFLAVFGALVGLMTVRLLLASRTRFEKFIWMTAGAFAISGGVWSMHFLGMVALGNSMVGHLDGPMTWLSILPALLSGFIVLHVLSRVKLSPIHIAAAGLSLGVGIGAMHFIGMAAMRDSMQMVYDPLGLLGAIGVAVVLATVALSVKYQLEKFDAVSRNNFSVVLVAAIMGLATSGMHYTAIAAVTFYPAAVAVSAETGAVAVSAETGAGHVSTLTLAITVILFMVSLLGLIAIVSAIRRKNQANSLINAIIDTSNVGFLIADKMGTITMFSPGAEEMFGWDARQVVGKPIHTIIGDKKIRDRHPVWVKQALIAKNKDFMGRDRTIAATRKDGSEFPLEINVAGVGFGSDLIFCATMRDVSDRVKMERAQEEANRELAKALERQKETNRAQRDFVTMASHEFRTPLAIIDGGAQRIMRKKGEMPAEDILSRVTKIRSAVSRMQRVMESILGSASSEDGSIALNKSSFDIAGLVEKLCVESEVLSSSHVIERDLSGLPDLVVGDPLLVGQAIGNLISNALKYSPNSPRIEIRGWTEAGKFHIIVTDFGVGIPKDELDQVCSRFFRASSASGIPGTGIGLNLARRVAREHDGSLGVESVEGKGSVFTISFAVGASTSTTTPEVHGAGDSQVAAKVA